MKFMHIIAGLAALFAASGLLAQTQITLAGSDLIKPAVAKPLEKFAKDQGMNLSLQMDGTIPALRQLAASTADVAIIARPAGSAALPENLISSAFCSEVVYVLVNSANPLTEINLRQLAAIFGEKAESAVDRWSVAGLSGVWGMRSLLAFCPKNDDGLTLEIFKNAALPDEGFKPGVRTLGDANLMFSTIGTQEGAIGLSRFAPPKDNAAVKVLLVSTGRGGQGHLAFSPTMENAYLGDYPLNLPFFVIYPKDKAEKVAPLLHYLYSDEFAQELQKGGFLPIPSGSRKNMMLGIDNARRN